MVHFYISEINISGLAGSSRVLKAKLNKDVNVFFGPNGFGKTSLLKILNSALHYDTNNLKKVPFNSATITMMFGGNILVQRSIYKGKGKIRKEVEGKIKDPSKQSLANALMGTPEEKSEEKLLWKSIFKERDEDNGFVEFKAERMDYVFAHRYLPTPRLYLGVESGSPWDTSRITEEELEAHFAKSIKDLWTDYTYDISINTNKAQAEGLANILKDVLTSERFSPPKEKMDLEKAYERVKRFLSRQQVPDILGSFDEFRDQYKNINFLKNVIKDIDDVEKRIENVIQPRSKLEDLIYKMFSGNKTIYFEDKNIGIKTKNDIDIELGSLSSGEKHLLRIFIETLMAKDNPTIIDEPELSMHIDWQDRLISAMQELNPSTQIIMATHSPEISANVSDNKLFRL